MNDNFNTRMILTTAAFAAVAALLVGPASAYVMDVEGGGGNATSVTAQPTVQPGTIPHHTIGVDQSQFAGTIKRPSRRRPRGQSRTSATGSASIRASSRASSSRSG